MRIGMQAISLGGDPRKHQEKSGEVRQEREESRKRCVRGQVTCAE